MSPELFWLAAVALLTALMWVPYILSVLAEMGVVNALMGRVGDDPGNAAWAIRAQHAHRNAIENLVIFAPLAIGVHVAGVGSSATAAAAMVTFWARLAHYLAYCAGIPVVRTLLFVVGVICQLTLGLALLGAAPA
ncbi:MAG: MAPEG family protein [Pseudomonadota bacterium]